MVLVEKPWSTVPIKLSPVSLSPPKHKKQLSLNYTPLYHNTTRLLLKCFTYKNKETKAKKTCVKHVT